MGQLNITGNPGTSFFHRLDSRCKLAALLLISIASLKTEPAALLILIGIHILILERLRISFLSVVKEIRYFLLLLLIIFAFRSVSGAGIPITEGMMISVTKQGIYEGAAVCFRLLLIMLSGLVFISTTAFAQVKAAVEWFLKPVPFVPEKKAAVMIGLLMRFFPLILRMVRETADAQKSRCIDHRKNPVYRFTKLSISVLRKTFENADNLAAAMEARCYSEIRTDPSFSFGQTEYRFILLLSAVIFLL